MAAMTPENKPTDIRYGIARYPEKYSDQVIMEVRKSQEGRCDKY